MPGATVMAWLSVALFVAGCQSPPPAQSAAPGATPGAGVTAPRKAAHASNLTTATIADPKTFNPILVTDNASNEAIGDLFDLLVRTNPKTNEVEPALAERWERNEDGTQWTFFLREDVKWHDGQPLTAADVVFTFDAIFDERVPNSSKHILLIDGQRIRTEAVDPHTVRMKLPRPFAPFLNVVTVPVVPRHLLETSLREGTFAQQWGIDTPPDKLVGSGPYQMVKYVPSQYIQYKRNPSYWMKDEAGRALPYLEQRTRLIVPNMDTMYLKFLSGETDVHSARPEEVSELRRRDKELDLTVQEIGLDTGSLFIIFNRNPQRYEKDGKRDPRLDWFTDKVFLRALAHAVDKQAMVLNCLYGLGAPAIGRISPENKLFHHPGLQDYAYDLEKAKKLLAEGGYADRDGDGVLEDKNGARVEITLHTNSGNQIREKICSILKEDWTKLGIRVNYRPLDFQLLVEKLDSTFEWDTILMGFTGSIEPHDSANFLRSSANLHVWHPNQKKPATAWEAEIDRLVDAGSRELDPEKRRQIYWRIEEILHEELPVLMTVREKRFTAYRNVLRNFEPTAWGIYRPERIAIAE